MSLFSSKKEEVVLFSALEGRLTYKGESASNAKITLWYKWKDKKGESVVYTADENGYFSIPTIKDQYKPRMLAQLVITQRLTVSYNDEEIVIWVHGKMSSEEFTELNGKAVDLLCELTDERERVEIESGIAVGTSCKWKSIK